MQNAGPFGFFDALSRYNYANAPSFGAGLVNQGMNTMNNLGGNIANAFGNAAAMSSANYQAGVPADVERLRQNGMNSRLQALAPLLAGIFSGGGGGASGRGFTTNYGAGVNYR